MGDGGEKYKTTITAPVLLCPVISSSQQFTAHSCCRLQLSLLFSVSNYYLITIIAKQMILLLTFQLLNLTVSVSVSCFVLLLLLYSLLRHVSFKLFTYSRE